MPNQSNEESTSQPIKKSIKKRTSPKFVDKLHQIISNDSYRDVISWNEEGSGIVIKDRSRLSSEVLPLYFRTGLFTSFSKQLNKFGFISSKNAKNQLVYSNNNFTQTNQNLTKSVKQKPNEVQDNQNELWKCIKTLRQNQEELQRQFTLSLRIQQNLFKAYTQTVQVRIVLIKHYLTKIIEKKQRHEYLMQRQQLKNLVYIEIYEGVEAIEAFKLLVQDCLNESSTEIDEGEFESSVQIWQQLKGNF